MAGPACRIAVALAGRQAARERWCDAACASARRSLRASRSTAGGSRSAVAGPCRPAGAEPTRWPVERRGHDDRKVSAPDSGSAPATPASTLPSQACWPPASASLPSCSPNSSSGRQPGARSALHERSTHHVDRRPGTQSLCHGALQHLRSARRWRTPPARRSHPAAWRRTRRAGLRRHDGTRARRDRRRTRAAVVRDPGSRTCWEASSTACCGRCRSPRTSRSSRAPPNASSRGIASSSPCRTAT